MVAVFIFVLHFIVAIVIFIREKRKAGLSEGILAVAFMGIVFAVGWTISTMLTNLLFTPEAFIKWYYAPTDSMLLRVLRQELNRETISLLILTFGEVGFYYIFLRKSKKPDKDAPSESSMKGRIKIK
jgi:hypothetical protein